MPTRTSRSTSADPHQSLVDQAKCKELALSQIAEGLAQAAFAGRRRLWPRRARRGQGEGQAGHRRRRRPGLPGRPHHDLGHQEGDEAAFTAARRSRTARRGRLDEVFDAKSGGVGYGKTNAEGAKYTDQVDEALAKIEVQEITDIPTAADQVALTEQPPGRPRAEGRHQALRRAHCERQRRLRPAPRRDPRPARRERRRQVDADERPLRASPARRGRDRISAASRCDIGSPRQAIGCGSAWCTSTSC